MTKKPILKNLLRTRNPKRTERRRRGDVVPDFYALIDDAVQGVIVHRNFKPLYANPAFAELFGYANVEEIMSLPLLRKLVPDDAWPRLETEYDDLMRGTKKSVIGRAPGLRKDGREIWLAVTMRVIDWRGEPAVFLTAFDISKQVEFEHGLLKNEQRLRAVLEILPYPIYVARRSDGQILFVNRKSCLLFQQSAGTLLRSKADEFFVDLRDKENLDKLFESVSDIRDIEVHMKTSEGRTFTAELAAIAVDYGGASSVMVALNDISQRKVMEAELFRQASTDALTGISNRRYFHTQAEQEMRRARRFAREMTVMMFDIDHFKSINDTYGHATGDTIIQSVVKRSLESLRQSDSLGRVGGEEFAVLLPETPLEAAREVAERLRSHICNKPMIAGPHALITTVSIGIAQLTAQDENMDQLLNRADGALYCAKNNGRNRVEVAAAPAAKNNV